MGKSATLVAERKTITLDVLGNYQWATSVATDKDVESVSFNYVLSSAGMAGVNWPLSGIGYLVYHPGTISLGTVPALDGGYVALLNASGVQVLDSKPFDVVRSASFKDAVNCDSTETISIHLGYDAHKHDMATYVVPPAGNIYAIIVICGNPSQSFTGLRVYGSEYIY